ncbi:MAG: hypothetical protein ACOCWG_05670 [bacterium]
MSRILIILTFFFLSSNLFAQQKDVISHLQKENGAPGEVTIIQDNGIQTLLNEYTKYNWKKPIKGYRIRIFSESGINAKKNAFAARTNFLSKYPYDDYKIMSYIRWMPPNYKVYVGDFRTKSEALKFQKMIVKDFPYAFYVNDEINVPD